MVQAHTLPAAPGLFHYGSVSRDRRRALFWSYFFLVVFAIFFLTPPIYMLLTSLKSSAEISAGVSPWILQSPTLSNFYGLLTDSKFIRFFWNSAIVSILVVTITMIVSVLAAFSLASLPGAPPPWPRGA